MKNKILEIAYIFRKPFNFHISIENIFSKIKENLPIEIESKNWIAPYYSKGLLSRLGNLFLVSRLKGDIYHITGDVNYLAFSTPPSRTILTIHDLGILNNTSNLIGKWLLKTIWVTGPVKRVAIVTVVSKATKKQLMELVGIPESKIRVIGNFISDSFRKSPKSFNYECPNILHIGSAYNKNLDRLIPALDNLKCSLTIIGYPSQTQVDLLNAYRINYLIKNNLSERELVIEYQQSDMLVFASILEGFGLPILEAQATGRPVVTSNCSSMPEVAGNGACLVNPLSIESIREGILKVINDSLYREILVENGLKNVNRFKLEEITKQYIDIYNECIANCKIN